MADENVIFKGDDTRHFGNNFITIKIKNPELKKILKIVVTTNCSVCIPPKEYTDPENFERENIQIYVNYTSLETIRLNSGANVVNVIAYDLDGYSYTCPQSLTFYARNGVISKNGRICC